MSDVVNPADVEAGIRETSNRIARSVRVCSERYETFLRADHTYDIAYANAYLRAEGPAHEKKYRAELDTIAERRHRDVEDAAYRYADRQAKALQDELRAWQSVGASVRAMYGAAGVGDR